MRRIGYGVGLFCAYRICRVISDLRSAHRFPMVTVRPTQCGDSMSYQETLLHAFLGRYGRLCSLVAQALTRGHDVDAVVSAVHGKGDQTAPVYEGIRAQRIVMLAALRAVKDAHISWLDIGSAVNQTRKVTEEEWMLTLPSFAEAVSV